MLGQQVIEWVSGLKCLGIQLTCQKHLTIDISITVRKVYAAANAILNHSKFVSETVRLRVS